MKQKVCENLKMCNDFYMKLVRRNKAVTEKVVSLLDEILKIAFTSDTEERSIMAYKLLAVQNPTVTEKLSTSQFFADFFKNQISTASDCLLSRFTGLMEKIIVFAPNRAAKTLPFFNELLNYVSKYPILMFLKCIVQDNDNLTSFQHTIKIGGFVDAIITKIQEDSGSEKNSLFGILSFIVQNSVFESELQSAELLESVIDITTDSAEQWCCLSNLVNEENVYELINLIPAAISTVHNRCEKGFKEFQVHALNFISSTLIVSPDVLLTYKPEIFVALVLSVFKDFPNSSIALQAAESATIVLMKIRDTLPFCAKLFKPFFETVLNEGKSIIQISYVLHVIQFIINTKNSYPEIIEKMNLSNDTIDRAQQWIDMICTPYGEDEDEDPGIICSPQIDISFPRATEIY